jgi:outer membrane protein OmpA-like peptidoglycan-associated protein
MKTLTYLIIIASAGLLISCAASVPPPELVSAREAYQRASTGQAAQLVPAELHKAKQALAVAESSFQEDATSFRTRDLAYVADRKAKLADALAVTAVENAAATKANKEYDATQTEIVKNAKADVTALEASGVIAGEQLAASELARRDAEKRAADAQAELAKLASVKEDARGTVITLSGSVFFASNKSVLLPAAQSQLNQVADALMVTKERKLTVEGHTDSQGESDYNQELSRQRADAVRSYIIARGYPGTLIHAQGMGEDKPVADNASAEGRANNRRVEIIVERVPQLGENSSK